MKERVAVDSDFAKRTATRFGALLVVLVGYEILASQTQIIPRATEVIDAIWQLATTGYRSTSLEEHLMGSLGRLYSAAGIALAFSLLLGSLTYRSKFIGGIVQEIVSFVRVMPPLSYYVLLVAVAGIGDAPKIALLAIAAFPPIFVGLYNALVFTPSKFIDPFRAQGISELKLLLFVRLPYSLPYLLSGVRLGVGFAFTTLVAAEILASSEGIGWVVLDASRYLRFDIVVACIVIIGLIGVLSDGILRKLEVLGYRWLENS